MSGKTQRGRSCTLPSFSVVFVVVALFVASLLIHGYFADVSYTTLLEATVQQYESNVAQELILFQDGAFAVRHTAVAAFLRSKESLVNARAAKLLKVWGANGTQSSFSDSEVVTAFLNASNSWGRFWVGEFLSRQGRSVRSDRTFASLSNSIFDIAAGGWRFRRRDGLCVGLLPSDGTAGRVVYRGNCSTCALTVSTTAHRLLQRHPFDILNWTANVSSVLPVLPCRTIFGARYCPRPPQAGVATRLHEVPDSTSWYGSSCFGMPQFHLRVPVPVTSPLNHSIDAPGWLSLEVPIEEYLASTFQNYFSSEFAVVFCLGDVCIPVQQAPDAIGKINTVFPRHHLALCTHAGVSPSFCLPTMGLVQAEWPMMYSAISEAQIRFGIGNETYAAEGVDESAATWFWHTLPSGRRIVVRAALLSSRMGLVVSYAHEGIVFKDVFDAKKNTVTRYAVILTLIVVATVCMTTGMVLLMERSRMLLQQACLTSLQGAVEDRMVVSAKRRLEENLGRDAASAAVVANRQQEAQSRFASSVTQSRLRAAAMDSTGITNVLAEAVVSPRNPTFKTRQATGFANAQLHAANSATLPRHDTHPPHQRVASDYEGSTRSVVGSISRSWMLRVAEHFKETNAMLTAAQSFEAAVRSLVVYVPASALLHLQSSEAERLQCEKDRNNDPAVVCFCNLFCGFCKAESVTTEASPSEHATEAEAASILASSERFGSRSGRGIPSEDKIPLAGASSSASILIQKPPVQLGQATTPATLESRSADPCFSLSSPAAAVEVVSDDVLDFKERRKPSSLREESFSSVGARPNAAFVLFDLGPCALDDADTVAAYLRMMRTVMSIFGAFGGCLERVEASRIVGTFNVHLPCAAFCEQAVACAARIAKYMEEQMDVWMYEESFTLRGFGSEYVIAVDAGSVEQRRQFTVLCDKQSTSGKRGLGDSTVLQGARYHQRQPSLPLLFRQMVIYADGLSQLDLLVPLLRARRFVCAVTQKVVESISDGNRGRYLFSMVDLVYFPRRSSSAQLMDGDQDVSRMNPVTINRRRHPVDCGYDMTMIYATDLSKETDEMRVAVENRTVEKALTLMSMRLYEEADATLTMYPWRTDTVNYLQHYTKRQLQLPVEERLFYGTVYNERLRWQLETPNAAER